MNSTFSEEEIEQIVFLHSQLEEMEQRILSKYKMSPQLLIEGLINKTVRLTKDHAPNKIEGLGFLFDSITQAVHSVYEED